MNEHLSKPIDFDQVAAMIHKYQKKKNAERYKKKRLMERAASFFYERKEKDIGNYPMTASTVTSLPVTMETGI